LRKPDAFERARISILYDVLSFPALPGKWTSDIISDDIRIGDLVSLSAAPPSEWYLSWVVDLPERGTYGLRSIETQRLCNWSNVGFNIYDRERVKERPEWKWCDKQYLIWDRLRKVCSKIEGYLVLPRLPVFYENGGVKMDARIRHGFDSDFTFPIEFDDWRKVTIPMMKDWYRTAVDHYESKKTFKVNE
jgi:hypothetical protein